jgi:glutaredoxin 3
MRIVIYSKAWCPYCSLLKAELAARGYTYSEFDLSDDSLRQQFYARTGTNSVPQLFISDEPASLTEPSGQHIGGWDAVSRDWEAMEIAR